MNKRITPTEIPMTTKRPLYKLLLKKVDQRRQKNREASLAKNKALSKPFSFHERDTIAARQRAIACDDIDEHMLY